ncbi:hypothetical protein [Methylobacterium sp. J-070]|uniref:hypothetical protein n=1 Tax=Methylobacterium sp. J-070 TaxID=2836650 RepID=UPI001FBB1463|nr:hypothetical protein [Methylobacterium sp. J-070]MCJ2053928.1 hypothetical protein [Methylobacterium sp. J-070]
MTAAARLDLTPPFLEMSDAIRDVANLSAIAVTVMENAIREIPDAFKAASITPSKGYIVVVLTEEQYETVHFINTHIKGVADSARSSLEAVEELIMERAR